MDFYFDFSSPYAYFASLEVDEIGRRHGRPVEWKAIMIGTAFKASGNLPLVEQPMKGAYSRHDWERLARRTGAPYRFPDPFPLPALAAARAFWWLHDADPARARRFAGAVFHAYFADNRLISDAGVVAAIGAEQGIDAQALSDAIQQQVWKDRLKDETNAAIGRGVFGAPFFFVDGEGFWGADRLPMVDEWLGRGGW
jgi:2-hydroxychromene-2-carboxylate isomerase